MNKDSLFIFSHSKVMSPDSEKSQIITRVNVPDHGPSLGYSQ